MMDDYKHYAPVVLRIGIALLLLWFGLMNIFKPGMLVGYLPTWFESVSPLAPLTFMVINGVFETLLAVLLFIGYFTRIAAFLAALHILGIGISLGYSDIAIRDIGLAIAAFAIFVHGPDEKCLEGQ
jgi:uncharacterized membrane protein YphA (DoxX/SURF4 family)